jgi:hypothetical protein
MAIESCPNWRDREFVLVSYPCLAIEAYVGRAFLHNTERREGVWRGARVQVHPGLGTALRGDFSELARAADASAGF